jgi:hypothetical protein
VTVSFSLLHPQYIASEFEIEVSVVKVVKVSIMEIRWIDLRFQESSSELLLVLEGSLLTNRATGLPW